jgi:hypothetical protein
MITVEHIQTFKQFGGNIDGWARMKNRDDTMTDRIWVEIEAILQNLSLINRGLAAESFKNKTLEYLKSISADEETEQALLDLSNNP